MAEPASRIAEPPSPMLEAVPPGAEAAAPEAEAVAPEAEAVSPKADAVSPGAAPPEAMSPEAAVTKSEAVSPEEEAVSPAAEAVSPKTVSPKAAPPKAEGVPPEEEAVSPVPETAARARGAELAGRLDLAPEVRLVPAAFHETYGYGATGVWRAPGSVTLLSDGDASLSMAARWGTIVATHPREDDVVELTLMNRPADRARVAPADLRPGAAEAWAAAGLSAVWALREAGYATGGVTLLAGVDLPDGVGLAASTATACAIALALRDMYSPLLPLTALPALVDRGLRAYGVTGEHETARCPATPLGRIRATLLGRARMAYLDDGPEEALVPLDVEAAGLRLVVVDTRVRAEPLSPVVERAPLYEVTAYLRGGDPSSLGAVLGPALNAAHARLNGDGVPGREQNTVVAAALGAGALGGRMIWDGTGRPVLLLLHAADLGRIRTAVTEACVSRDLRPPRFLTVSAFDRAARK